MGSDKILKLTDLAHIALLQNAQSFLFPAASHEQNTTTLKTLLGPVDLDIAYAPESCARLENVNIFGKSFILAGDDVVGFYRQSNRDYAPEDMVEAYKGEVIGQDLSAHVIEEECCFLGGLSPAANFFGHFIIEYIYRLAAFDAAGALARGPLVVYDDVPERWLGFARLYGVERIVRIPRSPPPRFKSVWIAQCPIFRDVTKKPCFWLSGMQRVREVLWKNLPEDLATARRIFIGRSDSGHRRLVNEAELEAMMAAQQFDRPVMHKLSAAEQIALVKDAEIIVAVQGSGTLITHFASPDCIVIEIGSPHVHGIFGSLGPAALLGQTYQRVLADAIEDKTRDPINYDMHLNMEQFANCLGLALAMARKGRPA